MQLLTYTFLVEGLFDKKVSKATYLYLKSGLRVSVEPTKKLREQVKQEILGIVDKIGQEKDWSPSISALCGYCDYLPYCPAREEIKAQLGIEIKDPPIPLN